MAKRGYGDERERGDVVGQPADVPERPAPQRDPVGRCATGVNGAVPAPKILAPAATLANA